MKLNASFTDLHLRLYDGYSYEVNSRKEEEFTRTNFVEQLYVMRGVGDLFEDASTDNRSDREMSIAMLVDSRSRRLAELEGLREEALATARRAVDRALGRGAVSDSARAAPPPFVATAVPGGPVLPRDEVARSVASTSRSEMGRYSTVYRFANQVGVEINKKIVISTSCIIFVLIGVPIGIRFPRGGVNMVIVVSSFVIGVYQVGLTNGEDWADRGLASPFWSMWAPSFLFLALGIFLAVAHGAVDRGGPRKRVARDLARHQAARQPDSAPARQESARVIACFRPHGLRRVRILRGDCPRQPVDRIPPAFERRCIRSGALLLAPHRALPARRLAAPDARGALSTDCW